MSAPHTLAVHTDRAWLVEDFASAGTIMVRQDHPWESAAPLPGEAVWAPIGWVTRLAASGIQLPLTSVGPDWMGRLAAKHPSLVGPRRQILTGAAGTVCRLWTAEVFAKPAEAKVPSFPARLFPSGGSALGYLRCAGYSTDLQVVLSTPILLAREFRCFIAGGAVTAASFYLDTVTGTTWDAYTGREDPALPNASAAAAFATQVLAALDGDHPEGFVLDVGQTTDGEWVVIEANASWSSAPYHADPAGVIASVLASQGEDAVGDGRFRFTPDPVLLARAVPLRTSDPGRSGDPVALATIGA